MAAIEVDIAIACNYVQHYEWWSNVLTNILAEVQHGDIAIGKIAANAKAMPDVGKNGNIGAPLKRYSLTDMNRSQIVGVNSKGEKMPEGLMQGNAEWVMWLDDDTVPPKGAIRRLLDLRREVAAGLYFLTSPGNAPCAYVRRESGFYSNIYNYTPGVLTRVDAVGMGCTLIHKNVYQKIMDTHELFQRPDASLLVIPKKNLIVDPYYTENAKNTVVVNDNTLVMPLTKPEDDDNRAWPFYAMEYGRTEDFHFAELCRNAGVEIYIDTTITCDHWKTHSVNYETYLESLHERFANT